MKIIQFQAENFKRLTAVTIRPDGHVIPLVGKNGAGKSSILDAITEALGGTRDGADKPIHAGASNADVLIDLGEIKVHRRYKPNGDSVLTLTNAEGLKYPKPQQKLSEMIGDLSMDPLEFDGMKPKEQAELLAKIAGLDLNSYDTLRENLKTDRAVTKKQIESARAQLAGMIEPVDVPNSEESISDLMAELDSARQANKKIQEWEKSVKNFGDLKIEKQREYESGTAQLKKRLETMQAEIDRLIKERDQLAERANKALEAIKREIDNAKENEIMSAQELANLKAWDETPIMNRISSCEANNAKVRQSNARKAKIQEIEKLSESLAAVEKRIDGIDGEIDSILEKTELPIKGLRIRSDGVYLGEIPFRQESMACRLRTSVAIGLAQNPKLRIMLIRDGGNLDPDSMKLLAEIAQQHDAQVWIERPDQRTDPTTPHETGILIVDGETPEITTETQIES